MEKLGKHYIYMYIFYDDLKIQLKGNKDTFRTSKGSNISVHFFKSSLETLLEIWYIVDNI